MFNLLQIILLFRKFLKKKYIYNYFFWQWSAVTPLSSGRPQWVGRLHRALRAASRTGRAAYKTNDRVAECYYFSMEFDTVTG